MGRRVVGIATFRLRFTFAGETISIVAMIRRVRRR